MDDLDKMIEKYKEYLEYRISEETFCDWDAGKREGKIFVLECILKDLSSLKGSIDKSVIMINL